MISRIVRGHRLALKSKVGQAVGCERLDKATKKTDFSRLTSLTEPAHGGIAPLPSQNCPGALVAGLIRERQAFRMQYR